jgi:hypothetical protein
MIDRRSTLRVSLAALSTQIMLGRQNPAFAQQDEDVARHGHGLISVFDPQFGGGAKGDGVTNDTRAIATAAIAAAKSGRPLHMEGVFAVANLAFPGNDGFLHVIGDPIFVQALPNTPCLIIDEDGQQQGLGYRITCTVVPHAASSKHDPSNVAINMTGFSASEINVRLGSASRHSADTGRFHTVLYADAATPFHYGNRIRLIANAVPAPRYGIRYVNRGKGVNANPNINMISGWFYALDTRQGDVLIDLADTTQTIVEGPALIEDCPNAVGIRAGNFTTIRDIWFEKIGTAVEFLSTRDTMSNNGRVERCQFSGDGHRVALSNALGAPPTFVECIGDTAIAFRDQTDRPIDTAIRSRSHSQPPPPAISFTQGGGSIAADQAKLSRRTDHHGRTTYQLRYLVRPAKTGKATMRLTPPSGYGIEHSMLGVRNAQGHVLPWGLGDDLAGGDHDWEWLDTNTHVINIRVTLFAVQ